MELSREKIMFLLAAWVGSLVLIGMYFSHNQARLEKTITSNTALLQHLQNELASYSEKSEPPIQDNEQHVAQQTTKSTADIPVHISQSTLLSNQDTKLPKSTDTASRIRMLLSSVLSADIIQSIHPDNLKAHGIIELENRVLDENLKFNQRLDAMSAMREITGAPPKSAIAADLLDIAQLEDNTDRQIDILEMIEGGMTPALIPELLKLLDSNHPQVQKLAIFRLAEVRQNTEVYQRLLAIAEYNPKQFLDYLTDELDTHY